MRLHPSHKFSTPAIYTCIVLVLLTAFNGIMWYNSISILVFGTLCFMHANNEMLLRIKQYKGLLASGILLFCIHLLPWLLANDKANNWPSVEKKLAFATLPLLFMAIIPLSAAIKKSIMLTIACYTCVLLIYLVANAYSSYIRLHNPEVFFYHQLVKPIQHNAVYLSAYISFTTLFILSLIGKQDHYKNRLWILLIILYIFLFLLASKTILTITTFILLFETYQLTGISKSRQLKIITAAGVFVVITLLFTFNNPVRNRFREVIQTDLSILSGNQYDPGMYLNAVQFRLAAWKFSWLLVKEKGSYLSGLGPAYAQEALNRKYKEARMYTGEHPDTPGGYLNLNAHNQFVQTFLQSGIIGLVALLLFLYYLFKAAFLQKNKLLKYCCIIISVFFLTESVLEGQYGIILCLFFPFLFFDDLPLQDNSSL